VRFRRADLSPFLSFGLYQTGERLVNFASWNLDKLLIGAWLGTELLGVYHLAYQLMIRPFRVVASLSGRVSRPIIARLQRDRERMVGAYLESVRWVALVACPLYLGACLVADPLVAVVYGDRWGQVADLFRILWPLGILYCIGNPAGGLVIATGRARVGFLWNCFAALVQVAAVCVGVQAGLRGVALAILFATLVVIFPAGFRLRWVLARVSPAAFLTALAPGLGYASVMGVGVWALMGAVDGAPAPAQLAFLGAAGAAIYAALVWLRERPRLLAMWGS
jgi:O-antigen/teichoic acid export membrane protein